LAIKTMPDWWWIKKDYSFKIDSKFKNIVSIEIDDSGRMADVNRENNIYQKEK